MKLKLPPRKDLYNFLERAIAARQRDKSIRQVGHQRLALVHRIDNMEFGQAAILRWLPETAQERMENILTVIGDTKLDGVPSPYDGLSIGIISALTSGGYAANALPVITGQDAEVGSIKSIIAGEQYSTIFKDTRELARVTVQMVEAVLNDGEPEVNDTKTYDNGVKVVPSYLLKPVLVTQDDWHKVLVDSGYYTEDQIK